MGRSVGSSGYRVQAIFYIVIGQKLVLQECATASHPLSLYLATVLYTGYPPPPAPPFSLPDIVNYYLFLTSLLGLVFDTSCTTLPSLWLTPSVIYVP